MKKTIKKQYYGIKFPFISDNDRGQFIDLNNSMSDKVVSEIMHVLLTQKGTRLRKPEFGTNLLKFIYSPNDEITWSDVKNEAVESVRTYVKNTELNNVEILGNDGTDAEKIFISIEYTVSNGQKSENNKAIIQL